MLVVVSNLFDSAWLYQNLLDEVSESVKPLEVLYVLFVPYLSAPQMLLATQTTPSLVIGHHSISQHVCCRSFFWLVIIGDRVTVCCFRGHTNNLILANHLPFQFLPVSQPSHCP
jgi:hypothetical protein